MSGGTFFIDAPHICGEEIHVRVDWSYFPGSYNHPPDGDEEWTYENAVTAEGEKYKSRCPKCGIDLAFDDIFMRTVEQMAKDDPEAYVEVCEDDYGEPEDFEVYDDREFERELPEEEP